MIDEVDWDVMKLRDSVLARVFCGITAAALTFGHSQDVPAINVDPGVLEQGGITSGDGAGGWSFRIALPIHITGLGIYDAGSD